MKWIQEILGKENSMKNRSSIIRYSKKRVFIISTIICAYLVFSGDFSSLSYAEVLSDILDTLDTTDLVVNDADLDDFIENIEDSEENNDTDIEKDRDLIDDSNNLSNELETISSKYNLGIFFNFGSQIERERLGLSLIKINSTKIRYSIKLSYGAWDNIKIRYNDDDYEVRSKNFGSNIEVFYYPKFFFPIYINLVSGYYYWKGDIKPLSSVEHEEIKDLKSDFSLHTVMVSSSVGWDFYFGEGWFLQHCLFGIGSVFTVASSFSDNEVSETKSELKHKLAKPLIFGPLNIGIGKLF